MYVWNLDRWYWWNYLQGSNGEAGFPGSIAGKVSTCKSRRPWFDSWVGKFPWRRDRLPTPAFLHFPHGSDSEEFICDAEYLGLIPLLGRSPGGGHGNPLQYSGDSPWTEEPGGLQSVVSHRVGHNWETKHTQNGERDTETRLTDKGKRKKVRCMERVTWKLVLPHAKQPANRNLLYDSGNSNRRSVTT